MNEHDFIKNECAVWGEDYVFDLIDRGYKPVQLVVNGKLRWWWQMAPLTQPQGRPVLDAAVSLC